MLSAARNGAGQLYHLRVSRSDAWLHESLLPQCHHSLLSFTSCCIVQPRLQTTGSIVWNASRCVSPITRSLPPRSLHLVGLSFSRSLMDLALFFFCFLLQPWNSPSGEKAVFRDASLHFVNIVGPFHPLLSASLHFSLGLYIPLHCFCGVLGWC